MFFTIQHTISTVRKLPFTIQEKNGIKIRQAFYLWAKEKKKYNSKITIMKKLSVLSMLLLFISMGNIQAQTVKEESRKQKKAEQELLDQTLFDEAKQAIEMKNFILEADHVMFKYGTTAFVSPNTNFVAVKGNKAVVQVAFNIPISGPNGLGGITVNGNISGYKQTTDKKGNISVSMNVMGVGISAQVNIRLNKGSNNASVDISPNFNSNNFSLTGSLLPMAKANVFKGNSL